MSAVGSQSIRIKRHQHEAAYRLGLARHSGSIGIAEAMRKLESIGLNPSSGASLVYLVSNLLEGRRYTRKLSVLATDDFLTWIARDRGRNGLVNAVKALQGRIGYYEKLREARVPKLRAILAKHRSVLKNFKVSGEAVILFEWRDAESRGFIDVLPLRLFEETSSRRGVIHDVRSRDGERSYQAKCNIQVRRLSVDLDYGAFEAFNDTQGMLPGIARLHFADLDRTAVQRVEWKPKGESKFKDNPFASTSFEQPPDPAYAPPKTMDGKKPHFVRERKGQARFRRKLKAVYGECCCLTGCSIPEALEGAHIDEYRAEASNNIRNGLLLRRDVHALFDRDLIAIDPKSYEISVSVIARTSTGYGWLHGKALRFPQSPDHFPNAKALKARWRRFKAVN